MSYICFLEEVGTELESITDYTSLLLFLPSIFTVCSLNNSIPIDIYSVLPNVLF